MIMKSFTAFLREAAKVKKEEKKTRADSKAVMQANRMGLKSDGHGGWCNERGEFVAKTEGDKLTFFNANQTDGERDPNQSETDKKLSGRMPPKPAPGSKRCSQIRAGGPTTYFTAFIVNRFLLRIT